jgi:hypothetical protein
MGGRGAGDGRRSAGDRRRGGRSAGDGRGGGRTAGNRRRRRLRRLRARHEALWWDLHPPGSRPWLQPRGLYSLYWDQPAERRDHVYR